MNYNSQMRLITICAVFLSFHNIAWGTDQIICNSESFRASFAVGSDGYVTNMVLQDKSAKYFVEVLEIADMLKNHRRVSMTNNYVDVKAVLGKGNAMNLVILMTNGHGFIQLGARKEIASCDWNV